jgi:thioredoxin reductase
VVVIGAGPAGFAASLGAMKAGLRFVTLEQDSLGGTVSHFPRGKLVMTQPAELPIVGKMKFTETTKEKLLDFWRGVEAKTQLKVNYGERVTGVEQKPGNKGFVVTTTRTSYEARAVLLTIGRRGTPRQLGVPGEERSKVVYRLVDPEQYKGMQVLVVGGGDSALEAACSIAEQPGSTVMLSYRSAAFTRAKAKNRDKLEALAATGRIRTLTNSNVKEIRDDSVIVEQEGKLHQVPNDAVIVSAGGILPTGFLKEIGITVETRYGTA